MTIQSIFKNEDKTHNKWLSKAFDIIRFRQDNKLKYIRDKQRRPDDYIFCHRHHIIPKSAFKYFGMPIDNSPSNKVVVTVQEHIKIHYFYTKYFQERIAEHEVFETLTASNAAAVNMTLHVNCLDMSDEQLAKIANEMRIVENAENSKSSKKRWQDPAYREKVLKSKRASITPEMEEKRIANLRYVFAKGLVDIESIGKSSHDRWQDQEYKKRTIAARKKFNKEHPESRVNAGKKISEALHRDPSVLINRNKKTGAAIKRAWDRMTPEQRKARSELLKKAMKRYSYEIIDTAGNTVRKFDGFD